MGHNLPSRLTSFIGREREIAEVAGLLGAHRLVTLVGAPGVGKTRLSLQIASGLLDRFPDGVWLVELAPLADPALVPQAVADVLGVREQPGQALSAAIAAYLRDRRVLLLLDNCEHLIGAAAALADSLLQACPELHVLATSREPLAIDGEVTRRVPSLSVPDTAMRPDGSPSPAHGGGGQGGGGISRVAAHESEFEAVRLFVERAQAVSPSFALTDRNGPTVAQICARLDGIPLAIELAAARVRALSVEQVAARLDDRFRLLTGGSRTALPRQQTLRGAVDWSYDLLSEPEQVLLRRLAVFAGGFSLDAVEHVGRNLTGKEASGFGGPPPADLLMGLLDKSLVLVEEGDDGERRYRLLETLREYGQEKLVEHDELADARDRHRDHFLAFAEEASPRLNERPNQEDLARIALEHDNLRAALGWCIEEAERGHAGTPSDAGSQRSDGAALGLRLAGAIWRFWWLRGHIGEGRRWLARMLAMPREGDNPNDVTARDTALLGIANLSAYQGDFRAAAAYMSEKLELSRASGNTRGVAMGLQRLGFYLVHLGEHDRAAELCRESVVLGRQLGDRFTLSATLMSSAHVAWFRRDFALNVACQEECLALLRELGSRPISAYSLRSLSRAEYCLDDREKATAHAEEALSISRELGDRRGIGESLKDFSYFAVLDGDVRRAHAILRSGIVLLQEIGDRWLVTVCTYLLAMAQALQARRASSTQAESGPRAGRTDDAVGEATRLYAAADTLREAAGIAPTPEMSGIYENDLALLREHLGEAGFAEAWAEGRAMSYEQAVEYALAITATDAAEPPDPALSGSSAVSDADETSVGLARLTRREREVAALVARGQTNRQIAEALVLSLRTVDTHVHHILEKLELGSRTQLAVWVRDHGLNGPP